MVAAKQVLIYPMLDATAKSQPRERQWREIYYYQVTITTGFDLYLDWHPRTDAEASPLAWKDWTSGIA